MINNQFKDKVVLVTGGTGSIGGEIVRRVLQQKPKLVKIYARGEYAHWILERELEEKFPRELFQHIIGDIRDEKRLDLSLNNVDVIFHAAGLKHVPYAEQNPDEAFGVNVEGGNTLIRCAAKHNVSKVIAVSTDKAVYPTSVMGITKLLMERLFISDWKKHGINTSFAVVRMGNILNTRGSVSQSWTEQVKAGHSITLTDKAAQRFMIEIDTAVDFILEACYSMKGREIFIPKMKEIRMFDLAQRIIAEHGKGKNIEIKITEMRDREKVSESLLTTEESLSAIEKEGCFIVLPNKELANKRKNEYE